MKKLIGIILAIAITSHVQAACKRDLFKGKDGLWFTASNVALLADYSTTLSIARSNGAFYESDPIGRKFLGKHPSTGNVQKYFGSRLLLNVAVQCYAPDKWNRIFFQAETVAHGAAAYHNYMIGLKFSF